MHYVVLTKDSTGGLPTVISTLNPYYGDYINSGYEIIYEGYKRDCEAIAEDMLTAYGD